jgi:hypothetical protein
MQWQNLLREAVAQEGLSANDDDDDDGGGGDEVIQCFMILIRHI